MKTVGNVGGVFGVMFMYSDQGKEELNSEHGTSLLSAVIFLTTNFSAA